MATRNLTTGSIATRSLATVSLETGNLATRSRTSPFYNSICFIFILFQILGRFWFLVLLTFDFDVNITRYLKTGLHVVGRMYSILTNRKRVSLVEFRRYKSGAGYLNVRAAWLRFSPEYTTSWVVGFNIIGMLIDRWTVAG